MYTFCPARELFKGNGSGHEYVILIAYYIQLTLFGVHKQQNEVET